MSVCGCYKFDIRRLNPDGIGVRLLAQDLPHFKLKQSPLKSNNRKNMAYTELEERACTQFTLLQVRRDRKHTDSVTDFHEVRAAFYSSRQMSLKS